MSCTIGGVNIQAGEKLPRRFNNQNLIAYGDALNMTMKLSLGGTAQPLLGCVTEFVRIVNARDAELVIKIPNAIIKNKTLNPMEDLDHVTMHPGEEWLFLNEGTGSGFVIAARTGPAGPQP